MMGPQVVAPQAPSQSSSVSKNSQLKYPSIFQHEKCSRCDNLNLAIQELDMFEQQKKWEKLKQGPFKQNSKNK